MLTNFSTIKTRIARLKELEEMQEDGTFDVLTKKEVAALLHEKEKLTIILVTHQMNDVANFADQVLVMESGRLLADKTPAELFSDPGWLKKHHLNLPQTTAFAQRLVERGMEFAQLPLTEHELAKVLATKIKEAEGENG